MSSDVHPVTLASGEQAHSRSRSGARAPVQWIALAVLGLCGVSCQDAPRRQTALTNQLPSPSDTLERRGVFSPDSVGFRVVRVHYTPARADAEEALLLLSKNGYYASGATRWQVADSVRLPRTASWVPIAEAGCSSAPAPGDVVFLLTATFPSQIPPSVIAAWRIDWRTARWEALPDTGRSCMWTAPA